MLIASTRVPTAKRLLQASSSQAMEDTLFRIRYRFRRWNHWLSKNNPYTDVTTALQPQSKAIDGKLLAEYIACSIIMHLSDGWVFLARAIEAMKSGDKNTAVHLGYYAELRAAMSLLASEGVGIFLNRHVAIGPVFQTADFTGPGTHQVTWDLLKSWGDDSTRVTTLLSSVNIEGRTIAEWLDEVGLSSSVQHLVARKWLESWSLDLEVFPIDKNLRNHVSYRPSRMISSRVTKTHIPRDVIEPVLKTWNALEPASAAGGAVIDRALLFHALSLAHNQSPVNSAGWGQLIDRLQYTASPSLQDQLRNPSANRYTLLDWANNIADPPSAQSIIARAVLLLRIANGTCANRLANAQITKEDLSIWWTEFGQDGGLWSKDMGLDSFADLWGEVETAISDIENVVDSTSSPNTVADANRLFGRSIAITQYPRAFLWLLGVDK